MSESRKQPRRTVPVSIRLVQPRRAATPLTWLLRLMIFFYIPFLLLVVAATAALLIAIAAFFLRTGYIGLVIFLGAGVLWLLGQLLFSLSVLFRRLPSNDEMELCQPKAKLRGLYELVDEVARQRGLRVPQEIRLAADTLAHVYEDEEGKEILVIGGLALTALSREALAGVLAHELGHFAAGDTRLSRRAVKRHLLMAVLQVEFQSHRLSILNPLVWLVRLYHLLYAMIWAAHSRQQEYAADRHEVEQIGKEEAAASLLLVTVTERLPWVRLSAIAEACVQTKQPMLQIFSEFRERAASVSRGDWQDACRKELKRKTGWFDSHPALRERLGAMGVSGKKALTLLMDPSGPPACKVLPEWDAIERRLTDQLIQVYQEVYQIKHEIAQIVLGRPCYTPRGQR